MDAYLALSRKHELLVSIRIRIRATIKPSHSIVQNPIKFQGEEALSVIVKDGLAEIECRSSRLLVIRNGFGWNCGLSLGISCSNRGFVYFKLIRVQDDFVFQGIKFFQTVCVSFKCGGLPDVDLARECEFFKIKVIQRHVIVSRFDQMGEGMSHDRSSLRRKKT